MDVLASCNVTELPEQQTRTQHLSERVLEDENLELGFTACCRCAAPQTSVECPACRRVKYCSQECRAQDASIVVLPTSELDDLENEDDNAMGHSSIICALLQTCNEDERAETTAPSEVHTNQVALARVESEYESYPATLTQTLLEGSCFQPVLRRKAQSNLVLHILGAARDAELEWKYHRDTNWVDCYCQSLSDLIETYNIGKIQLYFCGPDVVANDEAKGGIQAVSTTKQTETDQLELFLCPGHYTHDVVSRIPKVDIAIMFNPGLTCPDYPSWNATLCCIPSGTPIMLCTNTQMEVLADIQFLLDHGHVLLNSLPPPWMGSSSPTPEDDAKLGVPDAAAKSGSSSTSASGTSENFWGENAYAGWRVRQSSSMANDVYVKNRWMFGGMIDRRKAPPPTATKHRRKSPPPPPSVSKRVASVKSNRKQQQQKLPEKEGNSRKRRKVDENENCGTKSNSKRRNPALI